MAKISTKVKTNFDLKDIEDDVEKTLDSSIIEFTKAGATFMKDILPSKTGKLKKSIGFNDNQIWTTSDYYEFIDKGTKPHKITGNPLVFTINGITIFTTEVNHPGTKPHDITDKTVDYIEDKVDKLVRRINKVL